MNVAESMEWMSEWNVASSERTSQHWKYTHLSAHLHHSQQHLVPCLLTGLVTLWKHAFSACSLLVYAARTCNGWNLTCVTPHESPGPGQGSFRVRSQWQAFCWKNSKWIKQLTQFTDKENEAQRKLNFPRLYRLAAKQGFQADTVGPKFLSSSNLSW